VILFIYELVLYI